jgi:hypothetical protein
MQRPQVFLTRSAILTGIRAAAILLLIALILEGLARTESASRILPPPGTGSQHPQFDEKLAMLNGLLEDGEPLNCLIIGDSGANRNINPEVLRQVYMAQTGEDLLCFNFALGGMSAKELSVVADLSRDYFQPQVLIFGVTPGQFGRQLASYVAESDWARYRRGSFSIKGFLSNESAAFGYYLGMIRWFLGDPRADQEKGTHTLTRYGQDASTLKLDITQEQTKAIEARADEVAVIQDEQVAALESILALQEQGIAVWLVEMPFHEINYSLLPESQQLYRQEFLNVIQSHAAETDTPFIRVPDDLTFPDEQWKDSTHLNRWGAEIFSEWLGAELTQYPLPNQGQPS